VEVTMVFLTPPGDAPRLVAEYEGLDAATLGTHRKGWLRWSGGEGEEHHVVGLLRHLLRQESEAVIAPVAEYLRHTLKAFIRHIEEGPPGSAGRAAGPRESPELGELTHRVAVQLHDALYQIERYKSTSVRVLNMSREEYEVAKPILRRVNEEKSLGIGLYFANGRKKNTRTLGWEVIRALLERGEISR
jgi:hypothetical protein